MESAAAEPRSIRWHLFQVVLLAIVPIGLLAATLFYLHWQAQEEERERSQIQSVRLLATAVDNALDSSVQRMAILARLWSSGAASDSLMYTQSRDALSANPDWSTIVVFRAGGAPVFRADQPFDAPMPGMKLFDLWRPVVSERRAVISNVFTGPATGRKQVAVGVPVVRDGAVTHVMIATLNLAWFDKLLEQDAKGGVAGLFDRNWMFVSRSAEGEQRRGTDPASALIADMKRAPEGIGRYSSLNGVPVFTSWTPSRHGWWVALARPAAPIDNALWRYLTVFGALWLVVVAGGIAFAWRKSARIAGALDSLGAGATHLAAGRPLGALPVSRVREADQALEALAKASEALKLATQQRDAAFEVEREARAAAEAASRAKDEFLAMLGHELRNPLAAISNAVIIVNSGRTSREQVEFASGVIVRQTQHLKRLIDDLLDVGRVMTGKILLERQPLDLASSVRYVAGTLHTAGRFTHRKIEIEAAPVWIHGDETRMEQIITNLLVNAATYTGVGGTIRLRVASDGADAVLEVSDDGRGISRESLGHVFELFYQADPGMDRSTGGLGIGLTLVQRLVSLHGGVVRARSEGIGKGATFTVRIPAVAAPGEASLGLAQARPAPALEILIVEDKPDERRSLRMLLELHGHRVQEAADGAAALELLRDWRPDCAILDIGLPGGMDGYQLAGDIRKQFGNSIALVALSGYGGPEHEQRAWEVGFDRHFAKPADSDALLQSVHASRRSERTSPRAA
jgi:signal transduction histidine kinase/ActR/RegA family two-component response regulator